MAAFELSGVTKQYGDRTALRALNLRVEEGHATGLLGPNGAGKTTALRLLLGFCRPTAGRAELRGRDPQDPRSRVKIGYLPERLALPGRMAVERLLGLHATLAGLEGSDRDDSIHQVMEQVGILNRASDRISSLSKGLRQRVGFAQALLGEPTLLLLDEPTSGLDPIGIRDARRWVESAKERGCTVLISSHGLSEVERLCDRIAILHEGDLVASGSIHDLLLPEETLEDAFIRVLER